MACAAGRDHPGWHLGLAAAVRLARAPGAYDARDQQDLRNEVERADALNHKKDASIDLRKGAYITIYDTNGVRYSLTVSTAGALVVTAL